LFAIAYWIKKEDDLDITPVILEGVAVILLSFAGWLGGTLVYRNQIGVDPRYAEAGKWKEEYLEPSSSPIQVATTDELKVNQMKLVHIGDKRIVLGRSDRGYAAFEDRCTHRGGSLAGGALICGTVQCPWHGSQFSITTGDVTAGPANTKIAVYTLTENEGKIFITIDK
jgi:nitrite reductase/ring-hydroxylating ferredoxin subunit